MARRRFQKGSIRKRGTRNPVWELQYWEDYLEAEGTLARRRESKILGSALELTKRQALKLAADFLLPLNQGRFLPESTISLQEFVGQHFVPNAFPLLKFSTQKRYRQILNIHLLPAFGPSRLCDVRTLDIQQFVLHKMQGGLSWESVDHFRNLLSKIFTTAKQWSFFSGDNPACGVKLPEKRPVRERRVLLPEQIPALLAALKEPTRTMVNIGILTGLRVGEILALRWRDLDFASGILHVEQALYRGTLGTPKTKGSRRTLPIPEALQQELQRFHSHATHGERDALVFQSKRGTPLSDTNLLHRHLKPAGKRLGMPWLNWHTLRRTHATLFQLAGGSLREAQAQLGHARMSTTLEIYTLPLAATQRQAVEKLSVLVTNSDEKAKTRERFSPEVLPIQ